MTTESIEKELELCHYLVRRINKIIPLCNAVESITKMCQYNTFVDDNYKNIATITFMNGKSIYITGQTVLSSMGMTSSSERLFYNTNSVTNYIKNSYTIGFSYKEIVFYHWEAFCIYNGGYYDFNKKNDYKDLSIEKFMMIVNNLVVRDINKMLDETDF